MEYCAPGTYDKKTNTCLTIDQLLEMCIGYNMWLAENPGKNVAIRIVNDKSSLLKEIRDRFKDVCDNDHCITQQEFMNKIISKTRKEIQKRYRHNGPKYGTNWLTTQDINNVLEKYEKIYPDFKFLGAVALNCNEIDFCVLYNFSFEDYAKKNINKIGIVYNLDKYGQPGSHWVSLYADLKNGHIYFCDSAGKVANKYIMNIVDKFQQYCKDHNIKCTYKYNKNRHQHDNSECGVYSSNFIIRLLNGETFEQIEADGLNFNQINSCRLLYFATADSLNRISKSNTKIDPRCDRASLV